MKVLSALLLAVPIACATGSSTVAKPDAQACAPLVPAVIYGGTQVYETPDSSTAYGERLKEDTPVCASSSNSGFGYRRVKLANGKTGYVLANNLQD